MAKVKKSKNEVKEQPIEQVLWAAADKPVSYTHLKTVCCKD